MSRPAIPLLFVTAVAALATSATADDAPAPPAPPPAKDDRGALRAAVEDFVGLPVHGTLTSRYRFRTSKDGTDQDLYEFLNLHVGDESKDRVSGTVFARAAADLDRAHDGEKGFVFDSIDDTFHKSVNALLYTAYATIRPVGGAFESVRVGRQYVYASETFHVDGVWATTRPAPDLAKLRFTAYAGVPVHFYESGSSGDLIAGVRAEAEPWKGGRVATDYVHEQDRLSLLSSREKNDLAALSLWQRVAKPLELYGQFQWLDGPRDGTARATLSFPDSDLVVQASYYRLLESKKRLATDFDPYSAVVQTQDRYDQAELRASKGLGDHFDVEVGASARRLLADEETTPFNRDVRRVFVTPSMTDLPWKDFSVSVTGESYASGGEQIRTWALDVSQKFAGGVKVSAGSDYSLYAFGPLGTDERSHVRTAYARVKLPLSKSLTADVRYTWEKDDVETFHVLTIGLVLDF